MTAWAEAKATMGEDRITLGPQASHQWLYAPEHLAMVLARYRAANALIGDASCVYEFGCGEGIGVGILSGPTRRVYVGFDNDVDALEIADAMHDGRRRAAFIKADLLRHLFIRDSADAVVSLDVIEHIPADQEDTFMAATTSTLRPHGVCVIGTPNKTAEHLASSASRAGHVNLYDHDRLHALMSKHFHVVQSFGVQDTSLHLGHPQMRHYLMLAGIGPREGGSPSWQ